MWAFECCFQKGVCYIGVFGDGGMNEATTLSTGRERVLSGCWGDNKGRARHTFFLGVCGLRRIKKREKVGERGKRCAGEGSLRQKEKREVFVMM